MGLLVHCCGHCSVSVICVVEGKEVIQDNLYICEECHQVLLRYIRGWGQVEVKGNEKYTDHMIRLPLCAETPKKKLIKTSCPRCLGEGRAVNPGWMWWEVKK